MSRYLMLGVAGTVLGAEEQRILADIRPGGLVLFARNVESPEQLRELVAGIHSLPGNPTVAVDLEGGRVNRLRKLIGELPTPTHAAQAGVAAVHALGEAAGAACAYFGINTDLAPVCDLAFESGYIGGEGRCLAATAAQVTELAGAFLDGLESYGVAGCLKHYPGLGAGLVDSHFDLPSVGEQIKDDLQVFFDLLAPQRAVMMAHIFAPSLGDAWSPASLSQKVIEPIRLASAGPLLSDDLEMGALARFGDLPERAAATLLAGCDQALVCNDMEIRPRLADYLHEWAARDKTLASRLAEAETRLADYGRQTLVEVTWEQVLAAADKARTLTEGHG